MASSSKRKAPSSKSTTKRAKPTATEPIHALPLDDVSALADQFRSVKSPFVRAQQTSESGPGMVESPALSTLLDRLLLALLTSESDVDQLVELLSTHADLLILFAEYAVKKKQEWLGSATKNLRILSVFRGIALPKADDTTAARSRLWTHEKPPLFADAAHGLRRLRRSLEAFWAAQLQRGLPVFQDDKNLRDLCEWSARGLVQTMSQDAALASVDFFFWAMSRGGRLSLAALPAIVHLVLEHNCEYADIYATVYSLIDPANLADERAATSLFDALRLFLNSSHVPSSVVSAIVKKLVRCALLAPVSRQIELLGILRTQLVRHPHLRALAHRDAPQFFEKGDPWKNDSSTTAAAESNAESSSLWELIALAWHWDSTVSKRATTLLRRQPDEEAPERRLDDDEIFDAAMKRFGFLDDKLAELRRRKEERQGPADLRDELTREKTWFEEVQEEERAGGDYSVTNDDVLPTVAVRQNAPDAKKSALATFIGSDHYVTRCFAL